MKKIAMLLFAALLALLPLGASAESAALANPWVDCQGDMEKAAEVAGFEFAIPALSNFTVAAIPGEMIEVRYPRSETETIELRKSPMEPDEGDISGDFNEYPGSAVIELENGVEVAVRGAGDRAYVASFVAFDGAYSIRCEAGMTRDEVVQIIGELLEANAK